MHVKYLKFHMCYLNLVTKFVSNIITNFMDRECDAQYAEGTQSDEPTISLLNTSLASRPHSYAAS